MDNMEIRHVKLREKRLNKKSTYIYGNLPRSARPAGCSYHTDTVDVENEHKKQALNATHRSEEKKERNGKEEPLPTRFISNNTNYLFRMMFYL